MDEVYIFHAGPDDEIEGVYRTLQAAQAASPPVVWRYMGDEEPDTWWNGRRDLQSSCIRRYVVEG